MKKYLFLLTALIALSFSLSAEEALLDLLGTERVNAAGESARSQNLTAVYFSAHWCEPCKVFTPKLVDVYNQAKEAGLDFEVVFVSSDHSEEDMLDYMNEAKMPWLALPYDSKASDRAKAFKSDVLDINFIPLLVVLNSNGDIVAKDGRGEIDRFGLQALKKWGAQKPASLSRKKKIATKKEEEPEKLPAPEKDELPIYELDHRLFDLKGKVVEVVANDFEYLKKDKRGEYNTRCSYYKGYNYLGGAYVYYSEEDAFEFFEELVQSDSGATKSFYVHIKGNKIHAIGRRYRKKTGEYSW